MTNTLIKHWRLIFLALGVIILIWALYLLRTIILPFAVGLVLAYLLMPVVHWLERRLPPREKWPDSKRVLSVLLSFILLICVIGAFGYFVVTAVVDASLILFENAPYFIGRSINQVQQYLEGIRGQLPAEIRQELDNTLVRIGVSAGDYIRNALFGSVASLRSTFTMIIGFAVLPFFLFYIMKDSEKLRRGIVSALTPGMAGHARNIGLIIERVVGRYIRAQLMLGVVVAYFAFIGLLVMRIPYAVALALLAGVTEVIPTLGPWIGGAIAFIVTLALVPEKAILVAILFAGIQLVENNLLVPKIQSAYLRIHPAVMIVLLVLAAYLAGFWGLLIVGPLVATLIEIFKYVREQYQVQQPTLPVVRE